MNKRLFKLAIIAFSLNLGSSLNAIPYTYYYTPNGSLQTSQTDKNTMVNGENKVSDEKLTDKINDKIGPGWFSKGFEKVRVQVNNGNVTLQGTVRTNHDREKVEREVRKIEGVRNVNNQINVLEMERGRIVQADVKEEMKEKLPQDSASSPADEELNKVIRDKVSFGVLGESHKDISLHTANGVVTLTGTISSESEQQELKDKIEQVPGVRDVISDLRIKK